MDIAEKALANVHAENEFNLATKESHKDRMNKLKTLLNEIEEVIIKLNFNKFRNFKLFYLKYFRMIGNMKMFLNIFQSIIINFLICKDSFYKFFYKIILKLQLNY